MTVRPWSPSTWLLGANERQRLRVSQSLLGMPSLLMMQGVLAAQWRMGEVDGASVAWFTGLTWTGCVVFYALARSGLGERLSREPSLSVPQMAFAMACVGWAYALAASLRGAILCLMPLILSFGIFALKPPMARRLSSLGIAMLGLEMAWLAWHDPVRHEPLHEGVHWAFVAMAMAMMQVLSARLGQIRARLSAQKAELTQALEQIRLLATRDALTGLLNRRAALDELRRAVDLSARGGRPLVVALADLDHFKLVNDTYGHLCGDRVLQAFARMAERELRGADRVARWGGEEFLFVLPDTDESQARVCLERLHRHFAQAPVEGIPTTHPLSFSAGVSLCHSADDLEAAVERADRAMYSAKMAGRGRTCGPVAEPPAVQPSALSASISA